MKWLSGLPGPAVIGLLLLVRDWIQGPWFEGAEWVAYALVLLSAAVKVVQLVAETKSGAPADASPPVKVGTGTFRGAPGTSAAPRSVGVERPPVWFRLVVGG